jgi:MFS family permease
MRVYGYRWVMLAVTMGVNLTIQMLWIGYAPVASQAARYYGVSHLLIGLLAMAFMIAFIPLSLPASWAIDTLGMRRAVGFGAALMAAGGLLRGLAGPHYALVLVCTVAIAAAQPFLLNAWTTLAAVWFPMGERATAVGLVTLSNLVGTALGLVLSPVLVTVMALGSVQLVYGAAAAASAAAFLLLARARPATPPCEAGAEERALMLDGLKHALTVRPFLIYLAVVFVGMGVFNGVTTWVQDIVSPRGFSATDAGTLGALMLAGGVLGAVIMSAVSDRRRRRVRYLVLGLALCIPGLLAVTFARSTFVLFGGAAVFGFFLVSTSPIGMQFAAEITQPTPEGTSNGLIQLCGQTAVVFVYVMEALRTSSGSFTPGLLLAVALLALGALALTRLPERTQAIRPVAKEPA